MRKPIRYAAEVSHVREVTLRGTADVGFWMERLREEDLVPVEEGGRTQVLIIAADLRFLGIRFREVSLSVAVERPTTAGRGDAAFLVQAWSSCRFFAWCERTLFSTPYLPANVSVATGPPCSCRVTVGGEVALHAAMEDDPGALERIPPAATPAGWDGPVFLPRRRGVDASAGKCFFARIAGPTRAFPFQPARDVFTIGSSHGSEALLSLTASGFTPGEWVVREDALHAKSRTYSRLAAIGALTSSPPEVRS